MVARGVKGFVSEAGHIDSRFVEGHGRIRDHLKHVAGSGTRVREIPSESRGQITRKTAWLTRARTLIVKIGATLAYEGRRSWEGRPCSRAWQIPMTVVTAPATFGT